MMMIGPYQLPPLAVVATRALPAVAAPRACPNVVLAEVAAQAASAVAVVEHAHRAVARDRRLDPVHHQTMTTHQDRRPHRSLAGDAGRRARARAHHLMMTIRSVPHHRRQRHLAQAHHLMMMVDGSAAAGAAPGRAPVHHQTTTIRLGPRLVRHLDQAHHPTMMLGGWAADGARVLVRRLVLAQRRTMMIRSAPMPTGALTLV